MVAFLKKGVAVRGTKGFTLIELLIVVVIIGILAAIAIPKFANTKQKAYIASEKSDLRNLITAQEAYFSDNVTYATTITNLNYNVSPGNTITIGTATGAGWNATVYNNAVTTPASCGIFVGGATAPITGEGEGEPDCR